MIKGLFRRLTTSKEERKGKSGMYGEKYSKTDEFRPNN
jgi:hypothetical protein